MKNNLNKASQSGKRTHTLKAILEQQNGIATTSQDAASVYVDASESPIEPKVNVSSKPICHQATFNTDQTQITPLIPAPKSQTISQSIELFHRLIDKELSKVANQLDIDEDELKAWIDLQLEVPAKTIVHLLRTGRSLSLDPLCNEIGFAQHEDGSWQVFITVEGCSKLLNQHPQFNGVVFKQSDALIEEIPEWIECTIYRKDRILPITVREYFAEVKAENAIWQKMPRRMLRHRALQQCVRLAIT